MMNIEFKNMFDETIYEHQAAQLETYYKTYRLNGEIKYRERFQNGQLQLLTYYKEANEVHHEIMDEFFSSGMYISIVGKESITGGYLLETGFDYDENGVLYVKRNELFDVKGNIIAFDYTKDLITNIPEFEKTRKYFYDPGVNPNYHLFSCSYDENANGKLIEIFYNNYHLNDDGRDAIYFTDIPEDIEMLMELTGISSQLAAYYVSPIVAPSF